MPQVQVIQPIQQQPKRLRVAAYARVSSDSTDQLNSLSVQVDYYTHLIQENPNWDFAGIYADEGITGTSTKHREQFNRLLDDCRAGLIDRVLVKSASRFARNTADALASVREMKSLGVTVVFEKEGFDTETSNGEMILSMICSVAQEESLSISKNMKWGIRKRMQSGTYVTASTPFGYRQENRKLIPYEPEALVVRFIYAQYLAGESVARITKLLNSQYPKEAGAWNPPAVQSILTNEKYRGDTCCQKRYTPDTLPLQKKRNKSQLPKYYIQESHPAIIMPTDFEKVQALLSQKRTHRSQMHSYPLTKMAVCQFCGKMLSPKTRANGVRVWNCKTHIVDSTQCPIKPVYETELYGAFLSMYNKLFENRATLFLPIFNDLQRIQDIKSMQNEASNAVHTEILQISKQLHNLTRIHAQGYIEETVYQERRIRIEQQLAEKKKCLTCQKQNGTAEKALYQTKQIDRYMQNHTALTEFDEEAMRTIVKKIVVSNEAFVFELQNGLHLKEKRQ